jgi:shikimate dehydrogenase/3-dehydroquinate dehydratase type I
MTVMEIVSTYVPAGGTDPSEELRHPSDGATAVEIRADLFGFDRDIAPLVAASPLPVIVTLRSQAEGGQGPDDREARARFFARAASVSAAFFDLEFERDRALVGAAVPPEKVILSRHFVEGVPAGLPEINREMLAAGTRFVKLVATARDVAGLAAVLAFQSSLDRGPRATRRTVAFAAGEAGRASRLLGPLLAAPLAYAAWGSGRAASPGQYLPVDLLALIGHLQGRPRRLFGVVGRPVGGSLSPRMHSAGYRALGLPNLFVPIEVSSAAELDALVRPLGESILDEGGSPVGGLAVTMPWKEQAQRRCDVIAPRAQRARAVNTVLPRPGKVMGDCTDIDGITRVLTEVGVQLGGAQALVIGTGAAARAAVVALDLAGAAVGVSGRDCRAAAAMAAELGARAVEPEESARVAVVVNATPAGADGESSDLLDVLAAPPGTVAVDLAYGDRPTHLSRLAAARGWDYVEGREVLLFQGVAQFAAMNGVAPPVRAMAAAIGLEEVQG